MDTKKGGSPDRNLNFYDQVVRVGKGWVKHEFVLFSSLLFAALSHETRLKQGKYPTRYLDGAIINNTLYNLRQDYCSCS